MANDKQSEKWVMPDWMEKYRDMIGNTGGNPIEGLMNDKSANSFNNSVRTALIIAVESQIHLLTRLKNKGIIS